MDHASRISRLLFVASLAAFLLCVPTTARADSIAENVDGGWPTEKKVVIYTAGTGFVAATGYFVYSLVSWENSRADLAAFPRTPGESGTADCTSSDQCAELRTAIDDEKSALNRVPLATGLMFGLGLATCVIAAVWPNGNARVTPSASTTGGGLNLGGTF
jgi:hypothetical protein